MKKSRSKKICDTVPLNADYDLNDLNVLYQNIYCNYGYLSWNLHNLEYLKGSDQRENRGVWSNINTRYLVWRCGDGRSFAL